MTPNQPDRSSKNSTLVELQSIRHELTELRDELGKLRNDLTRKRPINIANQVAKGIIIAGAFWLLASLIFAVAFRLLIIRLFLAP